MKVIGLDAGTTTISGVLVDTETKAVLGTVTLENEATLETEHAWEDAQAPETFAAHARQILETFTSDHAPIDGIGITGQMHGILYLDDAGRAVSPLYTWQDGRGDQPFADGLSYARVLTERTGYRMAAGFGLTTHFVNLQQGRVPPKAVGLCSLMDYLALRLGGQAAPCTHPSIAHSLGLFDLRKGGFDPDALAACGMTPDWLPQIVSGEDVVGETPAGIPLCVPIGDNQASFLGAVSAGSNLLVNIGTSSQISVRADLQEAPEGLTLRPWIGGANLLVGSGLCGGSAYQLLRDFFNQVLACLGAGAAGDMYDRMAACAAEGGLDAAAGAGGLVVDARFRGSRQQPDLRGAIRGIDMHNFTPQTLILGVLRGIVDELKGFYDLLPDDLKGADFLVGGGNALRRNALLRKTLSTAFAKPLRLPAFEEEAALGAALLCASVLSGKPVGHFQDWLITYTD
jgi:sedoheptulokinase